MRVRVVVLVLGVVAIAAASSCRTSRGDAGPTSTVTLPPPMTTGTTGTAGTTGTNGTSPAPVAKPAVEPRGETVDGTLRTADGRDRTYHLYVPASLPAGRPVPLLLGLHGGTGWGEQFEANSGFDGIAEANGFLVVYPDGIEIPVPITPDGRVWNGGDCCAVAAREGVDDVGYLSALIDELVATRNVDPERVVAAGHSNGGIMAYRLACEAADKVAGVAIQSGWLGIDACSPSQPVPVLHIHGTADDHAPIEGGRGSRSISGVDSRAARESVGMLAAADGCDPEPTTATVGDLTMLDWTGCDRASGPSGEAGPSGPSGVPVRLVVVAGAGHAWMGRPAGSRLQETLVGAPYPGLDTSAEMWSFLLTAMGA